MNLLAFFLGLAFGMGFCYWQQNRLARHLRQILDLLPNGNGEISLPLISQLRRRRPYAHDDEVLLPMRDLANGSGSAAPDL